MIHRAALLSLAMLALVACDDARRGMTPTSVQTISPTMPPNRVGACADSALVDEKCTKAWYSCSEERSVCSRQWTDCCRTTSTN